MAYIERCNTQQLPEKSDPAELRHSKDGYRRETLETWVLAVKVQNPSHLAMGNSLLQTFKIVYSSYFYFLTLHSLFNVL